MKYKLIIDEAAEEEVVATVHKPSALTQQIEKLVQSYSGTDSIIGYKDDEMRKLAFDEIECVTVISRKVLVVDNEGSHYRIKGTLRDIENVLPKHFIRINKSTLANENCILRFLASVSGGVDAVFRCGYRDYVSRRCFADIRRRYKVK